MGPRKILISLCDKATDAARHADALLTVIEKEAPVSLIQIAAAIVVDDEGDRPASALQCGAARKEPLIGFSGSIMRPVQRCPVRRMVLLRS